ncbi:MAG TPA: (2Fe-2S) ferredoxin domain-containing protein [Planctomycetota bacterium]|nr:(2Fe-2S) ferredoxin domain-containing protein [Planctomycetota bacterium]
MAKFLHHLFVCENERPAGHPKGCCSAKGSPAVRQRMKDEIDARGWRKIVRANASGCLDQCERGVTVVVYPQNVWYGGVKLEDVPEILDALARDAVVERLRMPDERITGRPAPRGGLLACVSPPSPPRPAETRRNP